MTNINNPFAPFKQPCDSKEEKIGYINTINQNSINITINEQKFEIVTYSTEYRMSGFRIKLKNPTLSDIVSKIVEENNEYTYSIGNLIFDKFIREFKIIFVNRPTINGYRTCTIGSENEYFNYDIEYYQYLIKFDTNKFTPNGFNTNDKILFDKLKTLKYDELIKLKNYLIDFDKKFIYDLYINKDFNRKYKIFYEDQFIEIE